MSKIYYFAYPVPTTGGDFVNIEHVDTLRKLGFPASMVYPGDRYKYDKLPEDSGPIRDTRFCQDDYLVIPENDPAILKFAAGLPCHIVIHNQSTFFLLNSINSIRDLDLAKFGTMICPSNGGAKMLLETGYQGTVDVIHPALPEYFKPSKKHLQIAYSPRKLPVESRAVITMFRSIYPQYSDLKWCPILNMDRRTVAKTLAESAIYAAFSYHESINLSVLEAMRSGCITVGDHGGAGFDFAADDNGFWVRANEVGQFARSIYTAVQLFQSEGEANRVSLKATLAASKFDHDGFSNNLAAFWGTRVSR
jgi:hypothetical protein